jgi:hypothetical protein
MKQLTRNSYVCPFPRNKANENVLKSSRIVLENTNDFEKIQVNIQIPAKLTKSYMKDNKLYFDFKKSKSCKTNREKTDYSSCVIEKRYLARLLNEEITIKKKNIPNIERNEKSIVKTILSQTNTRIGKPNENFGKTPK